MAIKKAKTKAQPVKAVSTDGMIYGSYNIKDLNFKPYSSILTDISPAADISIEFITNNGIKSSLSYTSTANIKNNKLVCGYDDSKAYGVIIANGHIVSPRLLSFAEETKSVNDIDEDFIIFDYIEGNEVKTKSIQYTQNALIKEAAESKGSGSTPSFPKTTKSASDTSNLVTVSVTTQAGSVNSVGVTTNNIASITLIDDINKSINNIYVEINALKNVGDAVSKAGTDTANNLTIAIEQTPDKSISTIIPTITYASYNTASKSFSSGIMTDVVTSTYVTDITSSFQSAIDDISVNKIPALSSRIDTVSKDVEDISIKRIPELKDLIDDHEERISSLENIVDKHDTSLDKHDASIKDHESRITSAEDTISKHTKRIEDTSKKAIDVSNALDDLIDKVNGFSHHTHNKITGNDSYVSIAIDKTTDGNLSSSAIVSTTIADINIGNITDNSGTITYAGTPGTGLPNTTKVKESIQTAITNFYKYTVNNNKYVPTSKIASDASLTTASYSYAKGNISLSDSTGKQTYKVTMNNVKPFDGTNHGKESTAQIQAVSISVIDKILDLISSLDDRITALENADPVSPTPTTTEYTPVFLTLE